ncbi:MAG: hypothetical protein KGM16_09210 [Bacteroidota bacterium]|nr:hypothetical protein [Bacteroidota bacterium]
MDQHAVFQFFGIFWLRRALQGFHKDFSKRFLPTHFLYFPFTISAILFFNDPPGRTDFSFGFDDHISLVFFDKIASTNDKKDLNNCLVSHPDFSFKEFCPGSASSCSDQLDYCQQVPKAYTSNLYISIFFWCYPIF